MGKMNNLKKKRLMRRNMVGYSFIAPNFIGFAVFTMMPMLFSFGLSFCEWDSSHPIQFVGLQNFIGLLSDDTFWISLKNTIYFTVGTVPLTIVLSLGMSLLINQKIKGQVLFVPFSSSHMWRHWLQSALYGICCLTRIWVQSTVS